MWDAAVFSVIKTERHKVISKSYLKKLKKCKRNCKNVFYSMSKLFSNQISNNVRKIN